MTPDSGFRGPARCLIYCSKRKYGKDSPDDKCSISLVKRVVEYASGDYRKVILLGTTIGEKVFIIFEYDNPDHLSNCKVLGFGVKQSIYSISTPAEQVHSTVISWIEENERWNLSFPRQAQVCSEFRISFKLPLWNLITDFP